MKEEFKSVYDKLIEQNEEALKQARETVRITSKKNTGSAITIVVSGYIAVMASLFENVIGNIVALLAVTVCLITIKKILNNKKEEKEPYNEIYQNNIIKPLMKLFYDEPYFYMPKLGILREVFQGIEIRNFDEYHSSNLINGTINHCTFKIANVKASNYKYNSNDHYVEHIIFKGMLMEIELPKSFNNYLYLKNKENILFKNMSEIKKELKLKKYKMKIHNLEEQFDIYTSDENFTERVLSDKIMQKLLEYRNMVNPSRNCELTIKKNYIYLTLPNTYVPGTNVILYEDRESMYQELWKEYEKFNFLFELAHMIINQLLP